MQFLVFDFLKPSDLWLAPICIIVLYMILHSRMILQPDAEVRRIYRTGFWVKILVTFIYVLAVKFVFKGGDTALFYQGILDFKNALHANPALWKDFFTTLQLTPENPFTPYFFYDDYAVDITYNYMLSSGNLFASRLGLIPAYLFNDSYLCISLCFSFFALGGSLRLFKTFNYYYPNIKAEAAIAAIFFPSVAFWSAGFLKDAICFGCTGFFIYGVLNVFIRRRKIIFSVLWIIVSSYLIYSIKSYIFLVLLVSSILWLFMELNKTITHPDLKKVFYGISTIAGAYIAFKMYEKVTDSDVLKQYQLQNIVEFADYQRQNFLNQQGGGSTYTVNTDNIFLWGLSGLAASFFRPFPWEVTTITALLGAIEAMCVMALTAYVLYKKKWGFFKTIFSESVLIFFFVLSIIMAAGIGASVANFGALSRYKIPIMPFYVFLILVSYHKQHLNYPRWFRKICGLPKHKDYT